jgi:predicted transglutaminase-like cysteine proteinase
MPLGNEKLCWNEPFRTPAVDLQFAKWAYQEYKPLSLPAIAQMIKKDQLLSEWKKLDGDTFRKRLLKLSRAHFDSLFELSISDVLTIRQKLILKEVGEPDEVAFDPVTPLLRAALPLMQPNFDAIGGEGDSIVKKYLQSENQESQFIIAALNNSKNGRFISTEDRYTISAVTIQNLMPLAAFTALIDHLKDAYKRLSVPQKKKLENVFVPIPKLEGEDLEEKVFEWKFGQPVETLQIVLPISQKRYRHAKQESRLPIAEWVKYVVAESPELNYLSACFLNIFLQHPDWNPFEQTSAILAFVQHVITYAYDKDTTPKTDWPRYPIESLQEGIGDCEDSAILAAAIMNRLGFDVALLQLPGHCALGVAGVENMPGTYVTDSKTEQRYFYAESTGEGWQIGVLPDNHEGQNVEVYPVKRLIGE